MHIDIILKGKLQSVLLKRILVQNQVQENFKKKLIDQLLVMILYTVSLFLNPLKYPDIHRSICHIQKMDFVNY